MSSAEELLLREIILATYKDINPMFSEHTAHLARKLASGMYARGVRVSIGEAAQKRVRTIHQSVDAEKRVIWTCKDWREVMGYPQRLAIGHAAIDFLAPGSREVYKEFIWPHIELGEKVDGVTLFLLRSTGEILPATAKIEPMRDTDGSFLRTFARLKVTLLTLFSLCGAVLVLRARHVLDLVSACREVLMA